MAFVESFTPFFADFGVVATLDGTAVSGIFDRDYAQAFDGMATTQPTFIAPTASVAAATTASILVVAGTSYRVRSVQADGSGVSQLLLELQ